METHSKDIGYDLGDLSSAAIKKAARNERAQDRITWVVQVAVPVVLMVAILWICGSAFIEFLNGLSETITTQNGGTLK